MFQQWVETVERLVVRVTWRRQTWLTVKSWKFHVCFAFHSVLCVVLSSKSLQESKRVCAGRPPQRSTPTRPASTRHCARASKTCSHYQVRFSLKPTTIFVSKRQNKNHKITFFPFKMDTSTKTPSTTCATVSPATSCGATRLTTREESRPATTPCPLAGAVLPSGEKII